MIRRILVLLAASATAAAGLVAIQSTTPDPQNDLPAAQALSGAEFNPGNIISDENFYNGDALSESEVQEVLTAKNGSSAPTALRNYSQATPSMPATEYCAAYPGAPGGESAASIIAKVGQACDFSQKAMLVLLEKEQSLVSMESPSEGRLAAATGFGCPDTAPCDESYGGFFYQVYNAARQFQYYKANPYSFNHIPGIVNNVLYNPNGACGSSPVKIENSATAGLYNYTPYQPNQAALNNLYGEGDGCSAYGNRNFWWMYNSWFGDTHAESDAGSLIRADGTSEIYLLTDGMRFYISADYWNAYSHLGKVKNIPQATLDAIPAGPDATDRAVTTAGQPVFLGDDGKYWDFRDCDVMAAYGGDCDASARISPEQLGKFAPSGQIESFVRTPEGKLMLIQDGHRIEVSSTDTFDAMGWFTAATLLQERRIANLPYGEPILSGGVVRGDAGEAPLYIDGDGNGHQISESMRQFNAFVPTSSFTSESYATIPVADTLAPLLTDGSNSYLVTSEGVMRVNPAHFGAGAAFRTVAPSVITSLMDGGSAMGPIFVQGYGADKISLVSGGERVEFDDADAVQKEAEKRGIDATIHYTDLNALDGIPTGNGITNGTLLKPQGKEDLYVLDGMYLQRIENQDIARALGFDQNPITITTASFENIEQRSTTISTTMVQCGETTSFATNGQLYRFASPELQAEYGLETTELSPELCDLMTTAATPANDVIMGPDNSVYWISGGQKRHITAEATLVAMGGIERGMMRGSEAVLAQFPTGAPLESVPADYVPPATPEPTETPTPTPAPTETGTPTPAPTETATPTPTETQEPAVPVATGDVITNKAGNGTWIVDGDRLLQVGSERVAADLGLDVSSPTVVPQANFDAFAGKTAPLYTSAVRCGDVDYIGIGGELVPYASGEVAAAYALSHTALSPEICATLTISATATLGLDVTLANGNAYVVEGGALRLNDPDAMTPSETSDATPTDEPTTDPAATDPAATDPAATPAGTEAPAPTEESVDPTESAVPTVTAYTTPTAEPTDDATPTAEPTAEETVEPTPTATTPVIVLPAEIVSAMGRGEPIGA